MLVDPSPTWWGDVLWAPDEPAGGSGLSWVTGDAIFMARVTPLPPKRLERLSLSSRASRFPVEAPDGTAARPMAPQATMASQQISDT